MTTDDDLLAVAVAVGVADAPPAPWSWGDTLGAVFGAGIFYVLYTGTTTMLDAGGALA